MAVLFYMHRSCLRHYEDTRLFRCSKIIELVSKIGLRPSNRAYWAVIKDSKTLSQMATVALFKNRQIDTLQNRPATSHWSEKWHIPFYPTIQYLNDTASARRKYFPSKTLPKIQVPFPCSVKAAVNQSKTRYAAVQTGLIVKASANKLLTSLLVENLKK